MSRTEARIRRAAARGATLLDRKMPGWFRRVAITRLRMNEGVRWDPLEYGCILCQLAPRTPSGGSWWTNAEALVAGRDDMSIMWDIRHGFTLGATGDWEMLDEAWKNEIRQRRQA